MSRLGLPAAYTGGPKSGNGNFIGTCQMLKVMAGVVMLTYPGIATVFEGIAEPVDFMKSCPQPT